MKISRRSLMAGAGAAGAALAVAPWQAHAADPPAPRPLGSDLDLTQVQIVAPEEDAWQQLAGDLADTIALANGGTQPAVTTPQQSRFSEGWPGHVILLGQLGNNIEIGRLYGMRFAMIDSWFPGVDGYWIRTLIDPFGLGGNTLVLGASDLAGAAAAVAELDQHITGTTVPYLHQISISDTLRDSLYAGGRADDAYVAAKREEFEAALADLEPTTGVETDATKLHAIIHNIKLMGESHLLTSEPGFAELCHLLLVGYADFVNTHTEAAVDQLHNRRNMWTNGEELISVWATIENAEVFTDEDRSQVLQALHTTYAANAEDGYLIVAEPEAPRWNHEIFPAMSLVAGADYFQRHAQLPEADDWRALGDMIFHGNTSLISWDDGSDYLMHLPIAIMDYAMFTGQYEFLAQVLRPSADLNALMIDNAGSIAGGGDVYPYGYSGPYSWGHSQVMNAANWLFPEPIYGLLMERARTGPFSNNRASDLSLPIHRYLVDPPEDNGGNESAVTAVMAYPIDQGVYDTVVDETPSSVEQSRTFHKLAFRAGLDLDAPTLMMDGFSGGRHNHQDGNAIIGYTARQRIMLSDRDYMESMPEHHSGLVVVRDGQQIDRPELTRIDWVADVDGAAVSRSTVTDWDEMEWTRTIFTTGGDFHVVWDELAIGQSGSYLIKNQWQSLGNGELDGGRYRCHQQGATMIIDSLDDSVLQTRNRYGHFRKYFQSGYLGEDYWYGFADRETVLSQVQAERTRAAGDLVSYINVIATGDEGGPDLVSRRVEERSWQVTSQGEDWWFITGEVTGGIQSEDAVLSMFGPDRIVVAGCTALTLKGEPVSFEEPVIWYGDIEAGVWRAYPVRRDHVHYDQAGEPVRPEPVASGALSWSAADTQRVLRPVQSGRDAWRPGERGLPQPTEIPAGWQQVASAAGGEVTAVAEIPAGESAAAGTMLIGTGDAMVTAIDASGAVLWSTNVRGQARVNEITHHRFGDDELIIVATEDYRVVALELTGEIRWARKIPDDLGRQEQKGNLIGVTAVRLGYVNGRDAEPWLMVGTQFRWVYGLSWSGSIEHETMLYYYGIEDAVFADLDGDGVDEGAFALEYFYPSIWDDGTEYRAGSAGAAGFTCVDLVTGSGSTPTIVYGTKQNRVLAYQYASQERPTPTWDRNVGGQVTDLASGVFHESVGEEIILGTTGFHAWSLAADGTPRFRASIGDRVRQMSAVPGDGYLVVTDHGVVVALDIAGEETDRWRFPGDVAGAAVATGDAPLLVLADGTVLRAN